MTVGLGRGLEGRLSVNPFRKTAAFAGATLLARSATHLTLGPTSRCRWFFVTSNATALREEGIAPRRQAPAQCCWRTNSKDPRLVALPKPTTVPPGGGLNSADDMALAGERPVSARAGSCRYLSVSPQAPSRRAGDPLGPLRQPIQSLKVRAAKEILTYEADKPLIS